MITKRNRERGAALIESAITIPIILLISVAVFEFGRAYQTWQVLTNAAREGARVSIIAGKSDGQVTTAVRNYLSIGGLSKAQSDTVIVTLDRSITIVSPSDPTITFDASRITVDYPYDFMVLNGVIRMITPGSRTGEPITMRAVAVMRNEN